MNKDIVNNMLRDPKVSVLMPVHNNEKYLKEAMDSILNQTFDDFEFLIIDDKSTDNSLQIVESYNDPHIRLVKNSTNMGIACSLNKVLELAKGEYIAIMDADDVAVIDRFTVQTDFLDNHPEIGIVGSAIEAIDEQGQPFRIVTNPFTDAEIRWHLLLKNPFSHSAVMFRRNLIEKHGLFYDRQFETVQDYDFWSRLLLLTKGANISQVLLRYRVHSKSSTNLMRQQQLRGHDKIAIRNINQYCPGILLSSENVSRLRMLFVAKTDEEVYFDKWRADDIRNFLSLYHNFQQEHQDNSEIDMLQELVATEALRILLRFPRPSGWLSLLLRIFKMSPSFILKQIPRFFMTRLKKNNNIGEISKSTILR
jgi:glycosyltransferase involved in cell wall biosynthesis